MAKNNKIDFVTSNTGNHIVNTDKDESNIKIPVPQVDEKRGFAKASPNVPKYNPKTIAKDDTEVKKVIEENILPTEDEDKEINAK